MQLVDGREHINIKLKHYITLYYYNNITTRLLRMQLLDGREHLNFGLDVLAQSLCPGLRVGRV